MKDNQKSAKETFQVLKGMGYGDDDCNSMVQKGIAAGNLFDDLKDVDKGTGDAEKTASALMASLNDTLDPVDALDAVQKAIAKGSVVDDLGLGDAATVGELDALIAKGGEFGGGDELFGDLFDDGDLFGGDDLFVDDGGPTAGDIEIVKSLQGVPNDIATMARIQKGSQAQIASQAAQIASLKATVAQQSEALKKIQKGLDQPFPWEFEAQGATAVNSPFDASGSEGGGSVDDPFDFNDPVRDSLHTEISKAIDKAGPVNKGSLISLLGDLGEGMDTQKVKDAFDLIDLGL